MQRLKSDNAAISRVYFFANTKNNASICSWSFNLFFGQTIEKALKGKEMVM